MVNHTRRGVTDRTTQHNTWKGKFNMDNCIDPKSGCGKLAKFILAQGQVKDHNTIRGKVNLISAAALILNQGCGNLAKFILVQ